MPAQIEAIAELQPQSVISCHLDFNHDGFDFPAREIFVAEPGFDAVAGKMRQDATRQADALHLLWFSPSAPGPADFLWKPLSFAV